MPDAAVPVGEKEIIERALRRAAAALKSGPEGEMGVGFSEGIVRTDFGLFTSAWCAVVAPSGDCGIGGGLNFQLPDQLVRRFNEGTLLEGEIENFLQDSLQNPFEDLAARALTALQN